MTVDVIKSGERRDHHLKVIELETEAVGLKHLAAALTRLVDDLAGTPIEDKELRSSILGVTKALSGAIDHLANQCNEYAFELEPDV